MVLCTGDSPSSSEIVPDHCYALVADTPSSSSPFKVYNPWGTDANGNALGTYNKHSVYGLFNATAAFINSNFNQDSIGAAAPGSDGDVLALLASSRTGAAQGPSCDDLLLALAEAGQTSHAHDGCLTV